MDENSFYYSNGELKKFSEKEKKERIEKWREESGFPIKAYSLIKSKEFDKKKILPVVRNYAKEKKQCGLCIVGDVGIGKTVSIICLLDYLLTQENKYDICVIPKYVEYKELQILYKLYERGFYIEHKDNEKEKTYLGFRDFWGILFIDDIVSGWDMFDLINYRYNNNLITFLSSNLEYKEFKKNMGKASMRRIKSDMVMNFAKGGM